MEKKQRGSFTGGIGFVLAAAGSAVGLGNLWRFPYLAAKDGGGVFLLFYLILVVTFGFTILTTEVAIGRKTKQGPLTAYGKISSKWSFLGLLACAVPVIILPYYCVIGGWVLKYLSVYAAFDGGSAAADGYFTGFITEQGEPVIWMLVYLIISGVIVISGVDKGIEKASKVLMPILFILITGISIYTLTLKYTDLDGITRTGLQGLGVYMIPDFSGMAFTDILAVILDACGQLFFSISVAMGIMVAYGSYAPKESNLMNSINQIEFFDTLVALLAGLMIVPAVYTFSGTEGMSAGPGLMFVALPKIFSEMGSVGSLIGLLFFVIVAFAAVTSSVSIMEAIVGSIIDKYSWSRKKATIAVSVYAVVFGIIVCLGYNALYFELELPNGSVGQILDIFDYVSNNILMPVLAMLECILIGWIAKPSAVIDEVCLNGETFKRKHMYTVMVKYVVPALLFILLLQGLGVFG